MSMQIGKWGAALALSAVIHAGVAGWLYQSDEETNIEGGSPIEISLLGDAFQNESVAGNPSEIFEPTEPKIVDNSETETTELPEESVLETSEQLNEAEIVEPATTPTLVDPATTATVKPELVKVVETKILTISAPEAEPTPQTLSEPIAFTDAEPTELLTAEIQLALINIASLQPALLSERTISPPLLEMEAVAVEPEEAVTIEEVKPEVIEAVTVEPIVEKIEHQQPKLTVEPEQKKVPKKKVSKKPVKKKKKVKKKTSAGSNGKGKRNARAGDAKGSKTAKQNAIGKSKGKKSSKNGNASASNYKGKVRRKVKRSFRRPRSGKSRKDAVVRFILSTSGSVRSVKLVRSSGSKKLDQAALSAVRRASPFPKPPGNVRGASLNFTLPFGT